MSKKDRKIKKEKPRPNPQVEKNKKVKADKFKAISGQLPANGVDRTNALLEIILERLI